MDYNLDESVRNSVGPKEARAILAAAGGDEHTDFFTLYSHHVDHLVKEAKRLGYRKSKYAPGSTARMFHGYLQRIANKQTNEGYTEMNLIPISEAIETLSECECKNIRKSQNGLLYTDKNAKPRFIATKNNEVSESMLQAHVLSINEGVTIDEAIVMVKGGVRNIGSYGKQFDTDEDGAVKSTVPAIKRGRGRPRLDASNVEGGNGVKVTNQSALRSTGVNGEDIAKVLARWKGPTTKVTKMKDGDKADDMDESIAQIYTFDGSDDITLVVLKEGTRFNYGLVVEGSIVKEGSEVTSAAVLNEASDAILDLYEVDTSSEKDVLANKIMSFIRSGTK